ncbi:MAG TPA: flavodoxin domain-containing protein [Acidimicrobiia bacterium]|nr:flavodoxin domain-containing protein [Acidimicrobiia bacterium]
MNNTTHGAKVLVSAGSKHGSTAEIASRIATRLAVSGMQAETIDPEDVGDLTEYEAFVIGSAVYAGHWTKPARSLALRIGDEKGDRPVWLFSSGPIGDPPKPEEDPVDVAQVSEATNPEDHKIFSGKVDKSVLSFGERAILVAVKASEGDFRDWTEIEAWADGIAEALTSQRVAAQEHSNERIGAK